MNIGILLLQVDPNYRGGVNSYIHGLLGGLKKSEKKHQYHIIVYERNVKFYQQYAADNVHFIALKDSSPWMRKMKYGIRAFFTLPGLRTFFFQVENILFRTELKEIQSLDYDIFYSPSVPFFPIGVNKKVVISPHDIQHIHYPQYFTQMVRWYRTTTFGLAMKRASYIQASSHFMKKDFVESYHLEESKVFVVPEGVMPDFLEFTADETYSASFVAKYQIKKPYIFYPAQHWQHKNHKTLLRAVDYVRTKYGVDINLVFTGEKSKKFSYLYDFIDENKYENFVQFLGNIKFSDLFYAYHNAEMVAIPVVYESSSLPLKESMALGKCVLASKNGSNDEENKNDNIVLFDTYNVEELGEKIYQLHNDPARREGLVTRSKDVIVEYTWEKIAEQYIHFFETIV